MKSHDFILIVVLIAIGVAIPNVHAAPTLTIFPTSVAANQNIAASYILNLNGGTPNDTYALTTTGLPSAALYSFSSTLIGASGSSILTIQTSISTPLYCPGSYPFTVTATNTVLSTDTASATGNLHVNTVGPALAVSVSTDKSSYTVGDTVTISLASNRPAKGNLTIIPPSGPSQIYPYSSVSPPMKTLTVNLPGGWKVAFATDDYCGASAKAATQFDVEASSTSSTSSSTTSTASQSNTTSTTILTSTSTTTSTTRTGTTTSSTVTAISSTTETGTVTETSELTTTTTEQATASILTSLTQGTTTSTEVLSNIQNQPLESVLGAIMAVSVLTISIRLIRRRSPRSAVTCSNCGFMNPPSAPHFCVKCGRPLKRGRTQ